MRRGTRLLDAGCDAGLVALLAALRGAEVAAVDAAPAFLAIAREADLGALPSADAAFDAVLAVQGAFFAADTAALGELARVVRPGGRVVTTGWGPTDRCEYARVAAAMRPLAPPPPGATTPRLMMWHVGV